jgi:mono/diheme cytochrome c family protein
MRIRVMYAAAIAAVFVSIVAAAPMQNTWILGEDAETKKNPLTIDAKTLAAGKTVFKNKCERCHGPGGLGDGPDAEEDLEEMNLTLAKRAARNPDGVVYYKVLNGRKKPKMPAFKDELTEEQIWSVVAHVQSLRKKS